MLFNKKWYVSGVFHKCLLMSVRLGQVRKAEAAFIVAVIACAFACYYFIKFRGKAQAAPGQRQSQSMKKKKKSKKKKKKKRASKLSAGEVSIESSSSSATVPSAAPDKQKIEATTPRSDTIEERQSNPGSDAKTVALPVTLTPTTKKKDQKREKTEKKDMRD
ncbi:unnamed protein product [Litomosoides sigmodontis]|uniref:Uncharacterized protein n=1 Tax=Litomosoides sigmodontis TaxID=42156 RepID=A0A3P6SZY1_LITSI|nr:unnamed protein product [Litomosoides sigmodontis]